MPGRKNCTCVPREIRDIQHQCFEIQRDLLVIEDQIEAARQSIELPPNAPDIWNGNAPPTVEIEVHGALSVVVDDYIPEMRSILQRAATATVRSVSTEWNRIQHLESVSRVIRQVQRAEANEDPPEELRGDRPIGF